MSAAPRRRPQGYVVVGSFRAHLRARPAVVFDALDARLRPAEDSDILYTADPAAFFIVVQGAWWYRGEYRVVPDETGSNVEHTIVNVASRARVVSRIVSRRTLASAPAEFESLAARLRREAE
jgi:hypothetical protein